VTPARKTAARPRLIPQKPVWLPPEISAHTEIFDAARKGGKSDI